MADENKDNDAGKEEEKKKSPAKTTPAPGAGAEAKNEKAQNEKAQNEKAQNEKAKGAKADKDDDTGEGLELSDETKAVLWRIVRVLPMIGFAFLAWIALWLLFLFAALQFIYAAITGSPNDQLIKLVDGARSYIAQVSDYLGYKTDELPFPFSPFPEGN